MDKGQKSEKPNMSELNAAHLEPRVARLEVGLETLTRNVSEMATSIRENATETNAKIDKLAIAVTQAAAPKKTDWSLFISLGFFIMALGSAVFYPLNRQTQDNKEAIIKYHESMVEHIKLDNHPVGQAKIEDLEKTVVVDKMEMITRDKALDEKIQKETQLTSDILTAKLVSLDEKHRMETKLRGEITRAELDGILSRQFIINEKIYKRLDNLEDDDKSFSSKEREELRQ